MCARATCLTILAILLASSSLFTVCSSSEVNGCMSEGRWYVDGAAVTTREACLRCTCSRGALACSRRACSPAPPSLPPRCHLRHRREACCPEIHCPESITSLEHGASARFEMDDFSDIAAHSHGAVCVDSGTVYAAGSAMRSTVACEQCFCLAGSRRCVRPACLPPPAHCRARPAAGACCPQRYYCDHTAAATTAVPHRSYECTVNGITISEGDRVPPAEATRPCTQCFCLRGAVQCQPLSCAPPLQGCEPLLRPGECCPHQYRCHHEKKLGLESNSQDHIKNQIISPNSLTARNNDNRSSNGKSQEAISSSPNEDTLQEQQENRDKDEDSTIPYKVKRKTNESTTTIVKKQENKLAKFRDATTDRELSTTDNASTESNAEPTSTDQTDTIVKISVNGTINCTTILSTSEDVHSENNDNNHKEPSIDRIDDDYTFDTDEGVITTNNAFDDNDSFTINVTSSLRANSSHPVKGSVISVPKIRLPDLIGAVNGSKKKKEEYDFDYNEPTLPPSLPNLKIIPFVAADAVVDEDKAKSTPNHPLLEREDKHPIYYSHEKTPNANRREDVYNPLQYPIFDPDKTDIEYSQVPQVGLPGVNELAASLHQYAVSATLRDHLNAVTKAVSKEPDGISLDVETPGVNLFSPPIETEGGFVPKGPGPLNEYYAVYPSTQSAPHAPQLTTSMQLDTYKADCISSNGHRVHDGDTVSMACSICSCAWGELHCAPKPCLTPPGCERRPITSGSKDMCCGDLVCTKDKKTTTTTTTTTTEMTYPSSSEEDSEAFEEEYEDELEEEDLPEMTTLESEKVTETTQLPVTSTSVNKPVSAAATTKADEVPEQTEPVTNSTLSTPSVTNITNKLSTIANVALAEEHSTQIPNATKIHSLEEFYKNHNETTPTATEETKVEETQDAQDQQDYEEEEEDDDDEGFSFGSVLKLLLSDSYDSTPEPQKKTSQTPLPILPEEEYTSPTTTTTSTTTTTTTTTPKPETTTAKKYVPSTIKTTTITRKTFTKPTIAPFIPMPSHHLYAPPKNFPQQTSVNRIDHLVLGEATAIRVTSSRPLPIRRPALNTVRPLTMPPVIQLTTTKKPFVYPNRVEVKTDEKGSDKRTTVVHEQRVTQGGMSGPGLLKLSGCNIYGKMYRVGGIITELSSDCQECKCSEFGVQCKDLSC